MQELFHVARTLVEDEWAGRQVFGAAGRFYHLKADLYPRIPVLGGMQATFFPRAGAQFAACTCLPWQGNVTQDCMALLD